MAFARTVNAMADDVAMDTKTRALYSPFALAIVDSLLAVRALRAKVPTIDDPAKVPLLLTEPPK